MFHRASHSVVIFVITSLPIFKMVHRNFFSNSFSESVSLSTVFYSRGDRYVARGPKPNCTSCGIKHKVSLVRVHVQRSCASHTLTRSCLRIRTNAHSCRSLTDNQTRIAHCSTQEIHAIARMYNRDEGRERKFQVRDTR